jgi:hypothetical protein
VKVKMALLKKSKSAYQESLVIQVKKDFEARQKARRPYELSWQLNMNFLMGNQYCSISPRGMIEQEEKSYFWQEKQVYNHIAPIVETRLARLGRVRPKMSVRPFSSEQNDVASAKIATKVLQSMAESLSMDKLINTATAWSEVTGTVFYKVVWDSASGYKAKVGEHNIALGDVRVTVVPPFEIYPTAMLAQMLMSVNLLSTQKCIRCRKWKAFGVSK